MLRERSCNLRSCAPDLTTLQSDTAIAQRIDYVFSDRFSHASKPFAHVADTEFFQTMVRGEMRHVLSFLLYQKPLTGILLSSWAPSAPTVVSKKTCRQTLFAHLRPNAQGPPAFGFLFTVT